MKTIIASVLLVVLSLGYTFYTPNYDYMRDATVIVEIVNDEGEVIAHGSGVIVDGRVLTAGHVAKYIKTSKAFIRFRHGERVPTEVIRMDHAFKDGNPTADIAFLRIKNNYNYPTASISCGAQSVGTDLYMVGHPLDNRWIITRGYVMASRPRAGFEQDAWLGIDGTIWTGSSGGPVFNRYGDVVGIVSHAASANGGPTGLNFAVSGQKICKFLEEN